MDVELIFRRTLVYILAMAAIVGDVPAGGEPASRCCWPRTTSRTSPSSRILSTLVVLLLFTPGEEPDPGRRSTGCSSASATTRARRCCACRRTSTPTSTSARMAERLLEGVHRGSGRRVAGAVFLARSRRRASRSSGALGCARRPPSARLPAARQPLRARAGRGRAGERGGAAREPFPEAGPLRPRRTTSPAASRASSSRSSAWGARKASSPLEQRGGRPAAGAGRPGRHRVHERPPLPQPAREGRRAAAAHRIQREHPREHGLGHPGARPRGPRRALEPGDGGPATGAAATRCSGSTPRRGLPGGVPRRPARQPRCSAGTRRSRTSTSCTCPTDDGRALMVNVSVAPFQVGLGRAPAARS